MRFVPTRLAAGVAAGAVLSLTLALSPAPASAATYRYQTISCTETTGLPADPGPSCNAHAKITTSSEWGVGWVDFRALDERLWVGDAVSDGLTATAHVRYTTPSKVYYWKYKAGHDGWIELGSDGDLNEDNHIDIKVCLGDTGTCTGWAWGVT